MDKKEMSIAQEEYEMQHYGLTSNELADDFKEMVTTLIKAHLNGLIQNIGNKKLDEIAIETATQRYLAQFDTTFNKITDCFQQVYKIPENILLDIDASQDLEITKIELNQLKKDCDKLEKTYVTNKVIISKLQAELQKQKELQPIVETTDKMLNDLKEMAIQDNNFLASISSEIFNKTYF